MRTIDDSDFESLHVLGTGAGGAVVAVRERATGRLFARKRARGDDRHELRLQARLRHPNLLGLKGAGVDAGGRFLLLELAGQGDLAAVLGAGAPLAPLLADALRALAFLHSRGLIHGDLKPQNLLVDEAGRLKLADLGLARSAGAGEAGGTLGYMSPERLRGVPATPAGDLFGLGAAFTVALGAPLAVHAASASGEYVGWLRAHPDRTAGLLPLLLSLLDADPTRRPQGARAAARQLASLAGDPKLAQETAESRRAFLRPHALRRREAALEALRRCTLTPGVAVLRAAPGAGGSRLLEELAIVTGARLVDARRGFVPSDLTGVALVDDADVADERLAGALVEAQRQALEGQGRVTLIALVRPGSALDRRLQAESVASVDLPPLDEEALASIVAEAFPDRGDPRPFASALHRLCGGAPGRALSVLAALEASGAIVPGALVDEDLPGPEALEGLSPDALAETFRAHVAAALPVDSLERRLAALAARARRPVSESLARSALDPLETTGFSASVARLRDARVFSASGDLALDGEHLRAVVDAVLTKDERREASRRLADALAPLASLDGDDAALLAASDRAHLLLDAAEVSKVAAALVKRSLQREAATLLRAADGAARLAAEDRLLLARCLAQLGEFEAAVTEARAAADDGAVAALHLVAEVLVRKGDYATAVRDLEAARAAERRDAELDALLARALALSGQHDRALAVADEALARGDGGPFHVDVAITAALAQFYKGDLGAAQARYLAARDLARDARDRAREANATNGLGLVAQRQGRFDEARAHYAQALALAESCGDRARIGTSHLNLGTVLQELGQTRDAAREYRRSATVARLIGERVQSARARSNLANLLLYVGRLEDARTAAAESRTLAKVAGAGVVEGYAILLVGEIALVAGTSEIAAEALGQARDHFMALANVSETIEAETLLARLRLSASAASELAARARSRGLELHESQALLVASEALANEDASREKALAYAHRAFGLSLPTHRLDLVWRAETAVARASGDDAALRHHAERAERRLREAAERVDEEDRETFLTRPDRARLRSWLALQLRPAGLPSRGADARLSRLLSINRRLGAERDLRALLASIVDQAVELCGAERGFVLLAPEREGGPFSVMVARNIDGETIAKGQLKVSHSIAERVMKEGEPELTLDAQEDERYQQQLSIAALKLRSVLCVPLHFQGRTMGALYIDNRFRARAFGDDDLAVLEAFSDQASIALAQVRALEDARAARDEANTARGEVELLNARLNDRVALQETEIIRARREADEQRFLLARTSRFADLVGDSAPMRKLLRQLERIAATDLPVLVTGESGTGKELIARALFANGPRNQRPFVSVNCGAFNEGILESELFGHVRGAFTGADREREGLFQVADRGTLFLDEVGDMPPAMQVKLLRALQEGEIRKVGGKEAVKVNVRIVAATNRDLARMMRDGTFREDLFYRLNVVSLHLPPLRERLDDLPALCAKLLTEVPMRGEVPFRLSSEALALLARYGWPGNIRELRATLHNAALFGETEVLTAADFSNKVELARAVPAPTPDTANLAGRSMEDLEAEAIRRTLELTKGNKSETARLLGIDRKTLYNKLSKLRIRLDS